MMSTPEPFLTAEIAYRRERITQSFATARRHGSRRPLFHRRQPSTGSRQPQRRGIATSAN